MSKNKQSIICLGSVDIYNIKSPIVQLLASQQTNTIQQSTVRINCYLEDEEFGVQTIYLPKISSYNGNYSILQIYITEILGLASKNLNIKIFCDSFDSIEGLEGSSIISPYDSLIFSVANYDEINKKGIWKLN